MTTHLRALAALLVAALFPLLADAQTPRWPNKPIRIVVGFGAGSQPDLFARLYGERLGKALDTTVVIENKPGGAGNLATEHVSRSAPDGYTFLYSPPSAITVNPHIYPTLPFDVRKDLVPVATTVSAYLTLITNNDLPIRTVKDLVEYARANPGKLAYGSYGAGGFPHLMMVWIMNETGTQMLHVPYKSGAGPDLIAGRLQLLLEPSAVALTLTQSGRARAIASSGSERNPATPDLPTVSETLPGIVVDGWQGLWAPAGTPAEIIQRVNAEIAKINLEPQIRDKVLASSARPLTRSPVEMAQVISRESSMWAALIKKNGIRLE